MNLTIHMTESCNMSCTYCTRCKKSSSISKETLTAACKMAFTQGKTAGISFFGGEPLLERELICYALELCKKMSEETGKKFSCKMTTNGTLLDEDFLKTAAEHKMVIGLSFDGTAQDSCRRYADGIGTMADVEKAAKLILKYIPNSPAMMTIAPECAHTVRESAEYLYSLGFTRITATPAYGKNVSWTDGSLEALKKSYYKTAEFYEKQYLARKFFFFSPFDAKVIYAIKGMNPSEKCQLGTKQISVFTDGKIYPCTQFIGDEDFCIGDVWNGLSLEKRIELAKKASMPEPCRECELNDRCTNSCGCINRMETGSEKNISAFQCSYERMLIELCDKLGERLYKADPLLFKKRFENK